MAWNNTGAGTGWSGTFTYKAVLNQDPASGSGGYTVTASVGGASGTWTIDFWGLDIVPNTAWYLHLNLNGSTKSTMKAFYTNQSSAGSIIGLTARTAPSAPPSPSLTPTVFSGSLRCQWGASSAGLDNPVSNYYLKLYANGVLQWESYVGNTTYKDFDVSSWGAGATASFEVWAVGTYNPAWSGVSSASGTYKNRAPATPTNPSVPKTSYIPSETIRVSFTNNGDPDSNLAGFEVAMQNAAGTWYNSGQIMGTNASGAATYVDINTTGWSQGLQWKFFVRGYDSFGLRGAWSVATALVTMNTAPLDPTIGYPAAGSTVFNRKPHVLLTAAQTNDGTNHIAQVLAGRGAWLSTASDFSPSTLFSCGVNDNLSGLRKLVFQTDMVTDFPLGSNTIKSRMYDSFLYSNEISRQFTVAALSFTDPDLSAATMKIRAVHITELQTAIGTLRAAYGLGAVAWKAVTADVTKIGDDSIITQLQTAVQDIINQINNWDAANTTLDLAVIGLAGLFRWILKRFSLKTKNDEAVEEIKKKLHEIDQRCESHGTDLKCAVAMHAQVEEVHAAIQPLVKAVFGLLLKAKEGKVNGEIEEALRAIKEYLGI